MYETYGELNADKSNAVLVCHALSGNHHLAGKYSEIDKNAGWWDKPDWTKQAARYQQVFCDWREQFGRLSRAVACPSSINPATDRPYSATFPVVTVEDWVNSQALLTRPTRYYATSRRARW